MVRGVAQLVARCVWDAEVAGSSPVAPTRRTSEIKENLFSFIERVRMEICEANYQRKRDKRKSLAFFVS